MHERCRPGDLTFVWPESAQQEKSTVHPRAGDDFVIVQDSGQYKVLRQE